MSDESPTDLAALTRRSIGVESVDAAVSFYAPDAVWDASPWGMGVFEGHAAVRGFFEDWRRSYAGIEWEAEEIRDLGNGVTFAVILQKARVAGSSASAQLRYAAVAQWRDDLIVRNTTYTDIDEARAAAERLAAERGQAMSEENVEVVKRVIAALNQRNVGLYLTFCAPDVELITPVSPLEGAATGTEGIRQFFAGLREATDSFRLDAERLQAVGEDRVLALGQLSMVSEGGIPLAQPFANVYDLIGGKLRRVRAYSDWDEALKAVGLEE